MEHVKYSIEIERLQEILQDKLFPEAKKMKLSYFDSGLKGIILNCSLGNGKKYVIRCIRNPLKLRKLKIMHRLIAQSDVKSPRLLLIDSSIDTYLRLGAFITLEEKIEGTLVEDVFLDQRIIVQIARNLAHLHGITGRHWTRKKLLPHYGSYFNYCMRSISKNLNSWFNDRADLDKVRRRAYYRWFNHYKPILESITCFNLLHHDPAPDNHIFSDSGIYCLDFEESRFGIFWTDYWEAREYYCWQGKTFRRKFKEAYFDILKDPELEIKLQAEKFFKGKYCLSVLSSCRRKLNTGHGDKKKFQRFYNWYENRLIELLSGEDNKSNS